MMASMFRRRSSTTVPCTIEIENTFESLHAHVELHGTDPVEAGDKVLVHGDDIRVPYGQKVVLQRQATVTRANGLQRMLTMFEARFELTELYEVSFSSGRKL
jgi:hypothetical protein